MNANSVASNLMNQNSQTVSTNTAASTSQTNFSSNNTSSDNIITNTAQPTVQILNHNTTDNNKDVSTLFHARDGS